MKTAATDGGHVLVLNSGINLACVLEYELWLPQIRLNLANSRKGPEEGACIDGD